MLNKIWYLILFGFFSVSSSTYLWRIERKPPSYIFGSMHIPYKLVWPYLSNETRQAFLTSTHLYGEIDAKNDVYWDDFLECLVNRSTRTRRSNNSSYQGDILDVYLSVEARRLNKTVGSLEAPKYHCEREGWRYNITMWKKIIDYVKQEMINGTFQIKDIENHLKKSSIKKYICEEMTEKYIENLYDFKNDVLHIEERDKQMSKYIHTLLQHSKTDRYFFAIGAAHMLRKNENLIMRLKKYGYKITRICTNRIHIKKKYGCKPKKIMKHCLKKNH